MGIDERVGGTDLGPEATSSHIERIRRRIKARGFSRAPSEAEAELTSIEDCANDVLRYLKFLMKHQVPQYTPTKIKNERWALECDIHDKKYEYSIGSAWTVEVINEWAYQYRKWEVGISLGKKCHFITIKCDPLEYTFLKVFAAVFSVTSVMASFTSPIGGVLMWAFGAVPYMGITKYAKHSEWKSKPWLTPEQINERVGREYLIKGIDTAGFDIPNKERVEIVAGITSLRDYLAQEADRIGKK